MMITVVIPTYRREAFLRSALASVRNQSRRDVIAEVIVSENSDDPASLAVTAEFPDLPIRHIFQDPPVAPGTHFARIVDLATSEWVACLGDDDMWGRYHLEEAARCLSKHPGAIAYFSQDVRVFDESRSIVGAGHVLMNASRGERGGQFHDCWLFDRREIATACLAATCLNMWALVGKKVAVAEAFKAFSADSPGHDSDRYMLWLLSGQGPIVVGREVGLYYRTHQANACKRLLAEGFAREQAKAAEYTRAILADATAEGIPIRDDWLATFALVHPYVRRQSLGGMIPGAIAALRAAWPGAIEVLERPPLATRFREGCQAITPPVLWKALVAVRRWLQRT